LLSLLQAAKNNIATTDNPNSKHRVSRFMPT